LKDENGPRRDLVIGKPHPMAWRSGVEVVLRDAADCAGGWMINVSHCYLAVGEDGRSGMYLPEIVGMANNYEAAPMIVVNIVHKKGDPEATTCANNTVGLLQQRYSGRFVIASENPEILRYVEGEYLDVETALIIYGQLLKPVRREIEENQYNLKYRHLLVFGFWLLATTERELERLRDIAGNQHIGLWMHCENITDGITLANSGIGVISYTPKQVCLRLQGR